MASLCRFVGDDFSIRYSASARAFLVQDVTRGSSYMCMYVCTCAYVPAHETLQMRGELARYKYIFIVNTDADESEISFSLPIRPPASERIGEGRPLPVSGAM